WLFLMDLPSDLSKNAPMAIFKASLLIGSALSGQHQTSPLIHPVACLTIQTEGCQVGGPLKQK
ncbi:hypothetical protein, partial [Zooshikella harenae]